MDPRRQSDEERRREARSALARAARESETVGGGALGETAARLADHFGAGDAAPDDRIDLWGKRIGRALALVAALLLVVHLVRTYLVV